MFSLFSQRIIRPTASAGIGFLKRTTASTLVTALRNLPRRVTAVYRQKGIKGLAVGTAYVSAKGFIKLCHFIVIQTLSWIAVMNIDEIVKLQEMMSNDAAKEKFWADYRTGRLSRDADGNIAEPALQVEDGMPVWAELLLEVVIGIAITAILAKGVTGLRAIKTRCGGIISTGANGAGVSWKTSGSRALVVADAEITAKPTYWITTAATTTAAMTAIVAGANVVDANRSDAQEVDDDSIEQISQSWVTEFFTFLAGWLNDRTIPEISEISNDGSTVHAVHHSNPDLINQNELVTKHNLEEMMRGLVRNLPPVFRDTLEHYPDYFMSTQFAELVTSSVLNEYTPTRIRELALAFRSDNDGYIRVGDK